MYDLLIGSFSKAFLAAASASSYVLYPSCTSGVSSSALWAFKISFFNASTPSTVFALLIRLKKNWDVIPASFNSLIASSLAFFNNHSSIVIPGFESSCDFNNWSFNALTPSIVFAFLIWFKNKSDVTPAAFNSLIAFSFAYSNSAAFWYSSSLFLSSSACFANSLSASHLFSVSSVFESLCDFNNWSFSALTLSIVFAFLIWFKNKSDVTPASFNSFTAAAFAADNSSSAFFAASSLAFLASTSSL